ncbi:MAG: DUF58 domain-containing protein, partial [Micrococcales bacterium]|nr:DUF58 domain-containing protein [Micrococcales bacterium]
MTTPTVRPMALAVAGGMAVIGYLLGWPQLAVPGTVLVALFLVGLVASLGGFSYQISLKATRRRVEVGGTASVCLTIRNAGSKRSLPGVLRLPVGERHQAVRVRSLTPGGVTEKVLPLPTSKRARLSVGPVEGRRGDPFGLVERVTRWGQPFSLTVFPKTIKVPIAVAGLGKDLEGKPTGHSAETDITFHSLRDYQPGDDRRAIHWRSSQRTGRLMVRQSEDIRRSQLALMLATDRSQYGGANDFELAVSVAMSMALAQFDQAGEVALLAGRCTIKASATRCGHLLDQAAGWGLANSLAGGETVAAAAGRCRRDAPGATLSVLVTGSQVPTGSLFAATGHLPRQSRAMALRCQVGAATTVHLISQVCLATVGDL